MPISPRAPLEPREAPTFSKGPSQLGSFGRSKKTAALHITKLVRGRRKRKRNSLWIYASAGGTNKFPGTEKTNFSAAAGAPTSDVMEANNAFLEEYRIKTSLYGNPSLGNREDNNKEAKLSLSIRT